MQKMSKFKKFLYTKICSARLKANFQRLPFCPDVPRKPFGQQTNPPCRGGEGGGGALQLSGGLNSGDGWLPECSAGLGFRLNGSDRVSFRSTPSL